MVVNIEKFHNGPERCETIFVREWKVKSVDNRENPKIPWFQFKINWMEQFTQKG